MTTSAVTYKNVATFSFQNRLRTHEWNTNFGRTGLFWACKDACSGRVRWQLWKKYKISEFFLEKEQSPNRHLSVTSWRNGAIIGVTAVKPDKFPSLPTKPQLSVAATYIFVILSCALWFCGAFGWMWVLTLNAPWWGYNMSLLSWLKNSKVSAIKASAHSYARRPPSWRWWSGDYAVVQ